MKQRSQQSHGDTGTDGPLNTERTTACLTPYIRHYAAHMAVGKPRLRGKQVVGNCRMAVHQVCQVRDIKKGAQVVERCARCDE